jgi:L-lactate dehydrogenase complex protein LldG
MRVALAGEADASLLPRDCRRIITAPIEKEDLFLADAAVTDGLLGVAETGSVLLEAREDQARLLSLTAAMHVVLLPVDRIVPDLLDVRNRWDASDRLAFTLITGPSKTADIELQLVKGVHGPAQLHILLTAAGEQPTGLHGDQGPGRKSSR